MIVLGSQNDFLQGNQNWKVKKKLKKRTRENFSVSAMLELTIIMKHLECAIYLETISNPMCKTKQIRQKKGEQRRIFWKNTGL